MELKQKASLTGFRILFVLDMLFKKPMSKDEILQELAVKNSAIGKATKETLRLDINTLKSAGFEIENTGKSNGYKYKIKRSPIKFKLTRYELRTLAATRDAVIKLADWEYILKLYGLSKKISEFIEDETQKNELMNFGYFVNIDFEILKTLYAIIKRKKGVLLLYNSPNSGQKEISAVLKEIKYSNQKLYITGLSPSYPNTMVLRIDNILKILKILPGENSTQKYNSTAQKIQYKIKADTDFEPLRNEKILKKNKTSIIVENKYENDFTVLQRLLSCGENLLDVNDLQIKAKYIETLKNMQKIYGGE